ncbi:MAG TPA: hypothetical protein VHK47_22435 [Polyangia bacterium]|jgi:hypothetical protein|nr:hypothetical protein [Polyangia bacterium]
MSARLKDLQVEVAAVRRRLEEHARRLGALRGRLESGEAGGQAAAPPTPSAGAPVPLFRGLGDRPLDDVELTFEVLDTEDPGREGR